MPRATLEMFFKVPGLALGPSLRTRGVKPFRACTQVLDEAQRASIWPR